MAFVLFRRMTSFIILKKMSLKTWPKVPHRGPHWTLYRNRQDRVPGVPQHGNQLQLVLVQAAARQSAAVWFWFRLQHGNQLQLVLVQAAARQSAAVGLGPDCSTAISFSLGPGCCTAVSCSLGPGCQPRQSAAVGFGSGCGTAISCSWVWEPRAVLDASFECSKSTHRKLDAIRNTWEALLENVTLNVRFHSTADPDLCNSATAAEL